MPDKDIKSFRRGPAATIIGLVHAVAGFFSTVWSVIRIYLIGYREVFNFGIFLGIYNYLVESLSLLLWISGIGILRGKRWGKILAVLWAASTILFSIVSYYIKKNYRIKYALKNLA